MGSLGKSKTLTVPYINPKDCSLGFCSWHCPQWCYINLPPPPPPLQLSYEEENYENSSNFSPLVIAIIGILASAFLLVSYYVIISKFCKNSTPRSVRDNESVPPSEFHEEIHDTMVHVPWHVVSTGLDEALIKSIAVCKYKRGDGLVEGTECSVCLTEFQEDESLRLLPKCSHAFHLDCIDTWLKSHSNCPLCRALILSPGSSLPPHIPTLVQTDPHTRNESLACLNPERGLEPEPRARACARAGEEVNSRIAGFAKNSVRAMSDLGGMERLESIIEIRDEDEKLKRVRRSMSMDYLCQARVSIADVMRNEEEHEEAVQTRKRQKVLHYVMSPMAMKRSFYRGGFLCVGHGKGQINPIIPF